MELSTMMQTIRDVTSNVLETMFFQVVEAMGTEQTLQEWFPRDKNLLWARLGFSGPAEGCFYLVIPGEEAGVITANFLGMEIDAIEQLQRDDTVKEILNMIGGGTLSKIDQAGAFKLEMPVLTAEKDFMSEIPAGVQQGTLFVETDYTRLISGIVIRRNGQGE